MRAVDPHADPHAHAARPLDELLDVVLTSISVSELLDRALLVAMASLPVADRGCILLRHGDWLEGRAMSGFDHLRPQDIRVRIGEGIVGAAAAQGRSAVVAAGEIASKAVEPALRSEPLSSLYVAAVQVPGSLLGAVFVGTVSGCAFSRQDQALLDSLWDKLSPAVALRLRAEADSRRVAELEAVVESIPDAIVVGDRQTIRLANRAAVSLLGLSATEHVNRAPIRIGELLQARRADTGQTLSGPEDLLAPGVRGEPVSREIVVRHLRTGTDVVLRAVAAPVGSTGTAVTVCSDITTRKHAQAERDRLFEQAQQAVADRQHVMSVVSHDLRNPLNTIVTAASVLRQPDLPPEARDRAHGSLSRAATRMNQLIGDLLDVNTIEGGRLKLELVPQDPRSILTEIVELFAPQVKARGLEMRAEAAPVVPLVRGDRHRLLQALSNLVGNALKVTTEGSVTVRLSTTDAAVVFAVIDTGPGIPEAERVRIFEPYWRSRESSYKGTGLGLAIVRGIVEGHGGRIWIETPPKSGVAMLFTIPTV